MRNYVTLLNSFTGPIIVFWNGPELGMEGKEEMQSFLLEWGVNEEVIEGINWKDKSYAFFRGWMDQGIERRHLIKALRHLVLSKHYDSRDIEDEEWKKIYGDDWEEVSRVVTSSDGIYLPNISISELKKFSGCYLCGGGEHECLSEFRLLLEAFNIKYKLLSRLIY